MGVLVSVHGIQIRRAGEDADHIVAQGANNQAAVAARALLQGAAIGIHDAIDGVLAGIIAMLFAGLFEYNFGDSEFLMLFLGLITLPFAATLQRGTAGARTPVPTVQAQTA